MDCLYEDQDPLKYFLRNADLLSYLRTFRDILKVTKVSQLKYITKDDLASIGFTNSEKRRYRKAYDKYFPNPYFANLKGFLKKKKRKLWRRQSVPQIELEQFTEPTIKVPRKHIIAMEDISINIQLGVGQFGVVQQGTWTTGNQRVQVAIKCLGQGMTSNSTEFLKEAAVMHSIENPNIVRLYGVVLHLETLMLVTELAPLRSLLECLGDGSLRLNFPVLTLCDFAEQICDGMAYLENKRLIHRDLAARNILVFNKNKVKISDFGLSRALGVGKDYYQTNYNVNLKLPVAWCAPECILYLRFTSASDVWAFGVCLWEMFTYGFQPWAAFSGQQILEAIDTPNCQRLERPDCCPQYYYFLMRDTWSHDPHKRPKFRELKLRLRAIRPEEVITLTQFKAPEGPRQANLLDYKAGQVITILEKDDTTQPTMYYGVIPGGNCGLFDPKNTKPYKSPEKRSSVESLSPLPDRRSALSVPNLLRSDIKRHTYTGKRSIQTDMISCPQGDVKHTGHIGLDGAHFGDISFLDPAGCAPRQVLYKPPADSEQVPLINPNSPSHLKSLSDTNMPYPPKPSQQYRVDYDEIDNTSSQTRQRSIKKPIHITVPEPTKSRNILKRVKSATLGRSHKIDNHKTTNKTDEVHEYQEIVDPVTERTTSESTKPENLLPPESPASPKETSDFSEILLEEMESILRNIDLRRKEENCSDAEGSNKHSGLKKKSPLDTMKQMSAQEERTLNTAVAMANEITSKSMNDLDGPSKPTASPNEKHKLNFKFGQLSLHNHTPHESDKDTTGKQERRNFCDEAKAKATDIQSTITKECKAAYASLIEEPTASTSRMVQVAKNAKRVYGTATMPKPQSVANGSNKLRPATMPKPAVMPRPDIGTISDVKRKTNMKTGARPKERPLQQIPFKTQQSVDETDKGEQNVVNVLPLPPRSTKTMLIDMPRHIRKHPLKIPNKPNVFEPQQNPSNFSYLKSVIYQNTYRNFEPNVALTRSGNREKSISNSKSSPPVRFDNSIGQVTSTSYNKDDDDDDENVVSGLVKDYVSVEDLLEFADLKPCGRQRGVESDEVRIMMKVFNENVTPDRCLEALDFCDWDVHHAIKLLSIKISVGDYVDLENCYSELLKAHGDITKAVNCLNLQKR